MAEVLQIRLLSKTAQLPVRASAGAAGYDLFSASDCAILPNAWGVVPTDVAVQIPAGCYGRIAPRSSLALLRGISVGGGVIDADYRGAVGVILFNHSNDIFHVKAGARVAQLILERITTPPVVETASLDETTRGAGGFGSTGS